jgi:hypothetical protein
MIGKIKLLGLALVAALAIGAVSVASASAEVEFHSEAEKTFGTGEQIGTAVYDTAAGSLKCKVLKGTGQIIGKTAKGVTISPILSECTAFGLAIEWNFNGCQYTATSSGIIHLECPVGKEVLITVKAGNCSIGTPAQSNKAIYTNEGVGSTRDVKVTTTATNLVYNVYGPGTICGTLGQHNDGRPTGSITVKGYSDEAHTNQVGIWVE